MTVSQHVKEFGKVRSFLWPIKRSEIRKFLPISLMMFFSIFIYTVLRNTKDGFIMTQAGAEVVPFLKGGVVFPISLLFVAIYTKLANLVSRETLYYSVVGFFLSFFALFALVLYPARDVIQMSPETMGTLKATFPRLQHIFPIFGVWIYTAFYTFAELWGPVALNLCFWQFANEVTRTAEAKRFYSMFGFIGHTALIFGGLAVGNSCSIRGVSTSCDDYINATVLSVILAGGIVLYLYYWMNRNILTDPQYYDHADQQQTGVSKGRKKLSMRQSFQYILSSPYLGLIATLVFSYAFSMNLLGLMWKKQLSLQYPDPLDYMRFMGGFSVYTGVVTVVVIFFFKGLVNRFGWRRGAMATPLILLITAISFFAFLFFKENLRPTMALMGTTPLMVAVVISTVQQILSKSAKYALFDPTKEMSYIPLDQELKVKGKAAVDVTVHQLGKAAGGYVSGGLLVVLAAADLMVVAPWLAVIILLTIILWFGAVRALARLYQAYLVTNEGVSVVDKGTTDSG